MNLKEIEARLSQIQSNWPAESVIDAVTKRLQSEPMPPTENRRGHLWKWTLAGSIVMLIVGLSLAWTTMLAAPQSLSAQVANAIRKASTAHIVCLNVRPNVPKSEFHIWYSREHGVRREHSNWISVDDGKYLWQWDPTTDEAGRLIERRVSHNEIGEITKELQLETIRSDWRRIRTAELDQKIGDKQCQAHLIDPGPSFTTSFDNGATQTALRYIIWLGPQGQLVQTDWQMQVNAEWILSSRLSFEYDIPIPADRFTVQVPPGAIVVEADQRWANRFPLEKALGKVVSGGLLFAVHEVTRCENDMFYIVSSVRGTAEHLKKHPPVPRPFNRSLTYWDVCEQDMEIGVNEVCKSGISCKAHEVGVDYRLWLAIPRRPYWINDGIQTNANYLSQLETIPGRITIPLSARYWGGGQERWGEQVELIVDLPQAEPSVPLNEIVRSLFNDVSLNPDGHAFYGAVKNDELKRMASESTNEADYLEQLRQQIDWLNAHDEVKEGRLKSQARDWVGIPVKLPRQIKGQVVDADGKPVPNARVTVQIRRFKNRGEIKNPELPQPWNVVTDQQGQYEFSTDEPQLDYCDMLCITTDVDGFPKLDGTDSDRLVGSGILPTQVLRARRTLRGRMTDSMGDAVTQVKIRCWSNTEDLKALWSSEWVNVDGDGAFSLTMPKGGKALMEIVPVGLAPQVIYIPDDNDDLGSIRLENGTSVHGRVIDRQGKGISGTVVVIQNEEVKNLFRLFQCPCAEGARTDEDGNFVLPPFHGKCKIYVSDDVKEYGGRLSVYVAKPNSIPPQLIDLTGAEKTKEIHFRHTD